MTKKRAILITALFFAALLAVRLVWTELRAGPEHPAAAQGVLDLRDRDVLSGRAMDLNGEWEFYPGRFLMTGSGNEDPGPASDTFVHVPGTWNASLGSPNHSAYGYGSYRLRILVRPEPGRMYGIRIPYVRTASELFVNGQRLAGKGRVDSDPSRYTPYTFPMQAVFPADDGVIDVVVQAANFDSVMRGGIMKPVHFGSAEAIQQERLFSVGAQWTVCIVLAIHGLYAGVLFLIGTRRKELLWFLALVASAILMTVADDDKLLLAWIPLDFDWNVKLVYLSYVAIAALMVRFIASLLDEYAKTGRHFWFYAVCGVSAVLIVVTPAKVTLELGYILFSMPFIGGLIVSRLSFRSLTRGNADAIYVLLGITSVLANIVGTLGKGAGLFDAGYYPIDLSAAFFAFASYWFRSYFRLSEHSVRLAEKLQQADKQKDDFLANTAHELRNPLHGMLNIAQSVMERWEDREFAAEGRARMELLVTVGKRLSLLVNDLLDLGMLRGDTLRLQVGNVQAQAVASGVLDMLRYMADGKPVRLVNDIPPDFPRLRADENRLTQILFNLVHNALKFTDVGMVAIRASARDGMALIAVSDTGPGMDEKTRNVVFEPYEQGGATPQASGGGIGLGLSICKQLVELHGGTLQVESLPGQGSEFSFTLPFADTVSLSNSASSQPEIRALAETAATVVRDPAETEREPNEDRPAILAVDDDPVNLAVLESVLGAERYDIVKASSGEEALSLLGTRKWDLLIADVMMPKMSGYELARSVRERFPITELPILLLTARYRPEDIEAGFAAGANDYVAKPADGMELRSRVWALTAMRKSFSERLRMEAAWMQAQIQPHFLYNTLNSIAALSEVDPAKMRALLDAFSRYLRASFDFRNSGQLIPLRDELELVRAYLHIEKERFGDRLRIDWETDAGIGTRWKILPLSIQPIVENAVRHGITKRAHGGRLLIRITENGNGADIAVEDDGAGMDVHEAERLLSDVSANRAGVGLRNTDRRLKQLYGEGLRIRSAPGQGTVVAFRITKK